MYFIRNAAASICFLTIYALSPSANAKPSIFLDIKGVKEPKTSCKLASEAKKILIASLRSRPEVTLDLGLPPGKSIDKKALAKLLKARKLAGYGMVLRITKCDHQLHPPAKGKVYKVLMVEVGVAIDAEKIPSAHMALAGEGSSQVGTEVSRVKEKEKQQLLREALAAATKQAVEKSITKLTGKKKKRPRRKRRRGRR